MQRVVAITGANRGLGLGLAQSLATHGSDVKIVLCCRDQFKGRDAINNLVNQHPHLAGRVQFAQLEVGNTESHNSFINYIKRQYGEIDAIVNNAGILYKDTNTETFRTKFWETDRTNYSGTKALTEALLSQNLIAEDGQIINLGSRLANPAGIADKEFKTRLETANSVSEIDQIYTDFTNVLASDQKLPGEFFKSTLPFPEYSFLKILLHRWAFILGQSQNVLQKKIRINSVCPGWVKTDLGGSMATLEIPEGVDSVRWLLDFGKADGAPGQFDKDWIENWQGELIGNRKVVKARARTKKSST